MFKIANLGKDKMTKKSITRKYKNARITILDAQFKKSGDKEVLLDEEQIDKLLSDINKACDVNKSKYNPNNKRIVIANDEECIEELLNKENKELKETAFKEEFMDMYVPKYTLDQVYLCEQEKKQIITALNIKKHEEKMYKEWGFEETSVHNRALVFNFFGEPGTGKSMAAEAIGNYLDKKIYSINYANLESKYVGQTPKNIKKAFEKAREDDAVLVFEEADSFLGKRLTNITQSADYGVNITRSVMLLELEKFDGVVIFTTNLLTNYDDAFKRRILASVEFKMPDEKGREAIFNIHIPKKLPLAEDVTPKKLAQEFTDVSGADIKDIIFMAAIVSLERNEKEQKKLEYPPLKEISIDSDDSEEDENENDDENDDKDNNKKDTKGKKKIEIEAVKEVEIPEETVTMEDFKEAYKDIRNRYTH